MLGPDVIVQQPVSFLHCELQDSLRLGAERYFDRSRDLFLERRAALDVAPEPGTPREETGAAQLAIRVWVDGRTFCDFSDLDLDAQTVVASRLRSVCAYVLLPSGGRSRLSPDLERAAIDRATQLVASRGPGRLAAGFPPDVQRIDEEGAITLGL